MKVFYKIRVVVTVFVIFFLSSVTHGQTPAFTWMGGDDVWNEGPNDLPIQAGVYGTKGVPSIHNIPGARTNSITWIDAIGNTWIFGGSGYDKIGQLGSLNDLWRFNSQQFTIHYL